MRGDPTPWPRAVTLALTFEAFILVVFATGRHLAADVVLLGIVWTIYVAGAGLVH